MGAVKPSTKLANAHFTAGYTGINTNHPVAHDGIISTMYIVHNPGHDKKDISNVRVQVWRRVSGKYDLVGESQAVTFKANDKEILHKVKLNKVILVKKGDFFGFFSGSGIELRGMRDTSGGSALVAHGRKTGRGVSFSSAGAVTYLVGGVLDGDQCVSNVQLVKGSSGGNACPSGSSKITEAQCRAAAVSLKEPFDGVSTEGNQPSGCFSTGHNLYFNKNSANKGHKGYSPVCRTNS